MAETPPGNDTEGVAQGAPSAVDTPPPKPEKKKVSEYPFRNAFPEEHRLHYVCSILGEKWPYSYLCRREPTLPFTTTAQTKEKGCELFWHRYKLCRQSLVEHDFAECEAAWNVYDQCMERPIEDDYW